jgi:hypothetical protein
LGRFVTETSPLKTYSLKEEEEEEKKKKKKKKNL